MKPITHPLAIAYVEACSSGSDAYPPMRAWNDAGRPLYADPAPMPAPALGMRVWYSRPLTNAVERELVHRDVEHICPGLVWRDLVSADRVAAIDLITDFRTGEVLWRRS